MTDSIMEGEGLLYLTQKEENQPSTTQPIDKDLIRNRKELVVYVVDISEQLRYCLKTKELTISYIDHYLISFHISTNYLQLLGVTSLYLAQKLVENQTSGTMEEFLNALTVSYKIEEMYQLEMALCTSMKWNLNLVTPSDYLSQLSDIIGQVSPLELGDRIIYMKMSNNFTQQTNYEIFLTALRHFSSKINLLFLSEAHIQKINLLSNLLAQEIKHEDELYQNSQEPLQIEETQKIEDKSQSDPDCQLTQGFGDQEEVNLQSKMTPICKKIQKSK